MLKIVRDKNPILTLNKNLPICVTMTKSMSEKIDGNALVERLSKQITNTGQLQNNNVGQ